VSNYQNPMSTTTYSPYDSTGAPAAGEVGGVAASMNEREILSNKKTKPSLPLVYPRHDAAGPDDSTANYVAEAEEATIPVVDAALHDPRVERLRAAEQRAAEAEADRPAAERRLADETLTGTIPSSIGSLTTLKMLWLRNNTLTGTIVHRNWAILPPRRSCICGAMICPTIPFPERFRHSCEV
jgi:hypothetical protein